MWLFFLAMIINLVDGSRWARFSWSAREWRFGSLAIWAGVFLLMISLGLRPLYQLMISFSTLLVRIVSVYVGIVVCQVVGVALRTPRLRCYTLSRDVSFNFV